MVTRWLQIPGDIRWWRWWWWWWCANSQSLTNKVQLSTSTALQILPISTAWKTRSFQLTDSCIGSLEWFWHKELIPVVGNRSTWIVHRCDDRCAQSSRSWAFFWKKKDHYQQFGIPNATEIQPQKKQAPKFIPPSLLFLFPSHFWVVRKRSYWRPRFAFLVAA